ncbi:hypothetical protein [Gimesia panareensis]|uniref:hypothetical protein n=1 Tax=Gimesia panareensis TaxID=2527978 RepID=UPI0011A5AD7F|nr:hypothetical protein [Gimesia panareensis]
MYGYNSPDFNATQIPDEFFVNEVGHMVRFRFAIPSSEVDAFESHGSDLIEKNGCYFSHWPEYGALNELGGNRFCGNSKLEQPCADRAELNATMLYSLSKIVLHSLNGPDEDRRFVWRRIPILKTRMVQLSSHYIIVFAI